MYQAAPLPYPEDALVDVGISAETVRLHYNKHHCGYVARLNAVAKANPTAVTDIKTGRQLSLAELVRVTPSNTPIYNLAAQVINHDFYWRSLSPKPTRLPEQSALYGKIFHDFGNFASLEKAFTASAVAHFGSGWVWLCYNRSTKRLEIVDTHDAVHPTTLNQSLAPLIVCDVWEHAYYVDVFSDRPKYATTFWNAINWQFVEQNYAAAVTRNPTSNL